MRLGKLGVAIVLSLIVSLSLLIPGAFAQSVNHGSVSKATSVVVGTNQALQTSGVQLTSYQQTDRAGFGGNGFGRGFDRHFRFHNRFFFHRHFRYGGYGGGCHDGY